MKTNIFSTLKNLKKNWYFPISAVAFFCLEAIPTKAYLLGVLFVFIASVLVSIKVSDLWSRMKQVHLGVKLFSVFSAIGICLAGWDYCYKKWAGSTIVQRFEKKLPIDIDLSICISCLGAVCAFVFVYICIMYLITTIIDVFIESKIHQDVKTFEIIVYVMMFFISIGYMIYVFVHTDAFYGTDFFYDIIYTSDSPKLVKENVYLILTHSENDLRQPLFAIFAAPFAGIPYLVSRVCPISLTVKVILINSIQIILLLVANFLIAKMMKLRPLKRVCFMLLSSCTYTYMLFVLMMEQYIVAYAWLIFCIYMICEKSKHRNLALWGAGGTLLTSLVLVPFISTKSPLKNFKGWIADGIKSTLGFVGLMLAFGRFDIIYTAATEIPILSQYTGKEIPFMEKIFQYTAFIHNIFVRPDAGVSHKIEAYASWQLAPVIALNLVGCVVFVLVICSLLLNWDKKFSLIAGGWVLFSVIVLLVLGWGTTENGLILYSLYFGWAFLVLLFQLVEKIEHIFRINFLVPVVSIISIFVLVFYNGSAIIEMFNFALEYFPV